MGCDLNAKTDRPASGRAGKKRTSKTARFRHHIACPWAQYLEVYLEIARLGHFQTSTGATNFKMIDCQ
eukprot:4204176-Amphidinium_carterae.1